MNFDFNSLIYIIPAVVIAFSVHEFSHAFISYKLGDRSQKERGRMTLNPLKHLDPIGTLCLVLFGFGWAKPVQVDPYFYKNKKDGMIWTALAGPLSNLIVAFICVILLAIMSKYNIVLFNSFFTYNLISVTATINIGLGIFNLIPIPPLDGSKILMGILPEESYFKLMRYEMYLSFILIFVLVSGYLNGPLLHARSTIMEFYIDIASRLFGLG